MKRLINGVMVPRAGEVGNKFKSRVLNMSSQKREEPTIKGSLENLITNKSPKVCIYRRLGGLGDVMMTTPLLKHIRRVIPGAHIVYATDLKYANGALGDILRGNPYIDELVDYKNVTARDYDLFADVTTTGLSKERSGKIPPNRIKMFADQVGVDITSDPVPTYVISEDERIWAIETCNTYSLPRTRKEITIVGIHARSNDVRRTWPLEHTAKLIELLVRDPNVRVIVFDWHKADKWGQKQTFVSDHSIRYAAALVDQCDIIVAPDSSILHIAGALYKKTIGIFGPTAPESRINYYPNTTGIVAGLPCGFCWYSPSCGNKLTCLHEIAPESVYLAVQDKLKKPEQVQSVVIDDRGSSKFKNTNGILVKRNTGGFGDIVMTIPAIEALTKRYPTKKIYYAIPEKYWPAAENNPVITQLLDVKLPIKNSSYTMVVDLSSPCADYEVRKVRAGKPVDLSRVEIYARALGVEDHLTNIRGKYYPTETEIDWARGFIPATDKLKLGVVLHCAESYRDWPVVNFIKLIEAVSDKLQVIVVDPVRNFEFKNTVDGCGFPFRKSAALISQCDIVLTPDTSMLHIAAALDIPTVALFGPIDPRARCKGYNNTTVITADVDCIGCWRNANTPCKKTGRVQGYSACMENITVSVVSKTINELAEKIMSKKS